MSWRSGSGWVQAGRIASTRHRRQVASTRQRRGSEGGSDEPVGRGGRAQRRTASVAPAGAAGRVGSRLRLAGTAAGGGGARAAAPADGRRSGAPGRGPGADELAAADLPALLRDRPVPVPQPARRIAAGRTTGSGGAGLGGQAAGGRLPLSLIHISEPT